MNCMSPTKRGRLLYFLWAMFFYLPQICSAQCTPPIAKSNSTCKGTHLTSDNTFSGSYYLDGTESLATSTFKGSTYKIYSKSLSAGDTLRICNNAFVELSNATLGIVIVEPGATLMLTNASSLSSTTISNYGTMQLNITNGVFSMNNSGRIINNGVIDANLNDIRNSGKINNFGLILNVDDYSLNNSAATTCLGANSVMITNTVDNASANVGFGSNGDGSGCVYIKTAATSRCLTANGAKNSDTDIKFCFPTGAGGIDTTGLTNCGASGTGFGTGAHTACAGGGCAWPLSLTLLHFGAVKNLMGVSLSWTVTQQQESSYFEILRSGKGEKWDVVGTVFATQNAEGVLAYSLQDYDPQFGPNYYKLVEIDEHGIRKEYSVIYLSLENPSEVDFFPSPNPSRGDLNVMVVGPYPNYQLEIIDLTGKLLSNVTVMAGNNNLGKLLVKPSTYFLRLKIEGAHKTKKIVVQE